MSVMSNFWATHYAYRRRFANFLTRFFAPRGPSAHPSKPDIRQTPDRLLDQSLPRSLPSLGFTSGHFWVTFGQIWCHWWPHLSSELPKRRPRVCNIASRKNIAAELERIGQRRLLLWLLLVAFVVSFVCFRCCCCCRCVLFSSFSFVLVVLVVLVVVAVVRVAVGVVFVRSRFRRLASSFQSFSGGLRRPVHLSHLLHLLNV